MALQFENSGHDNMFSGIIAALLKSLGLPGPVANTALVNTEDVELLVKKDDYSAIPIMSYFPDIITTRACWPIRHRNKKSIPLAHPSTLTSPV